ncbi:MAG: hypothetical protein VX988_06325, partial [Planctomycetota bacterium]|nr:hypothetical protein [Planctomycetota bacterium]
MFRIPMGQFPAVWFGRSKSKLLRVGGENLCFPRRPPLKHHGQSGDHAVLGHVAIADCRNGDQRS